MRHASVQVRAKLTSDELERYENLFEIGKFLESQNKYDLAYHVQKEIEYLISPAIERLKEGSKERDRMNQDFIQQLDEDTTKS
ncbi:hypothetical protein BEP19_13875 [Ammoniphilus oxalaticus]|uniref:Uncharacterized protein n=1 Tax=Ammoniphilus oxalaticus TaxID=66863 RepID=A0A419SER9_9BACL|nr:hypothetical protein [Ammoniphilus oxalaticus]RKD21714.1 hypothetical protein BEP19_13875 [Ammoniphilus oxalaticus]